MIHTFGEYTNPNPMFIFPSFPYTLHTYTYGETEILELVIHDLLHMPHCLVVQLQLYWKQLPHQSTTYTQLFRTATKRSEANKACSHIHSRLNASPTKVPNFAIYNHCIINYQELSKSSTSLKLENIS